MGAGPRALGTGRRTSICLTSTTIRGLGTSGRSLRGVCNLAEAALRSKKELKKFLDEDLRAKELQFYKSVMQKNTNSEKIEALLASYTSHPSPLSGLTKIQAHQIRMESLLLLTVTIVNLEQTPEFGTSTAAGTYATV